MPGMGTIHGCWASSQAKATCPGVTPLDAASDCPATRDYSRGYLHHLVKAGEALGAMLLTWNNIAYYQSLMRDIRAAIGAGGFSERAALIAEGWERGDLPPR